MQANRARPWLASLFALLSFASVLEVAITGQVLVLFLPAVLPATAAVLFHQRKLQLQLTARAAIWTAVILNMLLAHVDREPRYAIAAVVTGALALLAAGRIPEGTEAGSFQPVAYQKTLTLSLVLALADTFTLWMWAVFALLGGAPALDTLGFFACAVVSLVGAIGLYRLRMWALGLNVLANIGIALVFGLGVIQVHELRIVFITTALAQLVVALPVLVGVIRRRPLELPAWLLHSSRVLLPVALVSVIALAVQPLFGRSVLVQLGMWLLS